MVTLGPEGFPLTSTVESLRVLAIFTAELCANFGIS